MFLSSIQTLWLTPKASESWEGGESRGTKETGTWQTCGRARFSGCTPTLWPLGSLLQEQNLGRGWGQRAFFWGCTGSLQSVCVGVCSCSHAPPPQPCCDSHCPFFSATGFRPDSLSYSSSFGWQSGCCQLEWVQGWRKKAESGGSCLVLSAGVASWRNDTCC